MSNAYAAVHWNRHKRVYDFVLWAGVALFIIAFIAISKVAHAAPANVSDEVMLIRALGAASFTLLHVILCIGPLARLSDRFAPLLYNRRHLGVSMFLLALGHALLALLYYGGFGVVDPLTAIFGWSGAPLAAVPFEFWGLAALFILFLMAATSHDFWLANLSPSVWKWLHTAVHLAYALVVLHVTLGAIRAEASPVLTLATGAGIAIIGVLHLAAGLRESRSLARDAVSHAKDPWIDVCAVSEILDSRARVVCLEGRERVAIFRHERGVSAVTNVCAHQGGPLGEGKIVNGCITCPWHGYQYLPENGQSPPPFTEKIHTYQVRVRAGRVLLNPEALPPGTPVDPAPLEARAEVAP